MSAQDTTADRLIKTVDSAAAWLTELDEATIRHRPSPDRWSIAEVIGHLIDSASNNHQRFIRAQEGEELVFPKYDQNVWAVKNNYHESDWAGLVALWRHYNHHLAHVIRSIPDGQLATPCRIGPSEPCTLEFLVTDYLDHLQHHLNKIRERVAAGG